MKTDQEDKYFDKYIKARALYRASRIEIGKLESERDEARHNNKALKQQLKEAQELYRKLENKVRYDLDIDREGMLAARKEKEYQILKTTVENQRERLKACFASNRDLINKLVQHERLLH